MVGCSGVVWCSWLLPCAAAGKGGGGVVFSTTVGWSLEGERGGGALSSAINWPLTLDDKVA